MKEKRNEIPLIYRVFKTYLRFLHNKVYYKDTYIINPENIPADGTPLLIVSNHQNCLNDPLGILFTINDRKTNFITRADVFAIHPLANKFFRSIGLLPAFRMNVDGEESLGKNDETFKMSEAALIEGNTVVMFPEAGHQDKHWLGGFSFGYTKLAFEAAEMGNFEKEVFILPSCNHYSDYFGIRNQFLVKFGTPISLKPYYELYKTKPRTAQREVNKLVREQIDGLMLNITDLENYDTIDFIRNSYGEDYAVSQKLNPSHLPDKLISDKRLFACLEKTKADNEEDTTEVYRIAEKLKDAVQKLKIDFSSLRKAPSMAVETCKLVGLLLLLPLWFTSLLSALPIYAVAMYIFKTKSKDVMFQGTFLFAISALFMFPIVCIATLIIAWNMVNVWFAIIYVLITPLLIIFAWNYKEAFKRVVRNIRYAGLKADVKRELQELKENLFGRLNKITNRKI